MDDRQSGVRSMHGVYGICSVAEKSETNFATTTVTSNFSEFTDTRNRAYTQLSMLYILKFPHLHQTSWYSRTGTGL